MREVEVQVVEGVTRDRAADDAGNRDRLRIEVRRNRNPEVEFVRAELFERRVAIRNDLEDDPVEFRLPAEIRRIAVRYRRAASCMERC